MFRCIKIKIAEKILLFAALIIIFLFITANVLSLAHRNIFGEEIDNGIFLPVIMYHEVYTDVSANPQYIVKPSTLENDLLYLKKNGYTTILTEDLLRYINNDIPLPEKPIMLTFDDGYYNNLHYALPLLKKYNMKAIISVVGIFSEKLAPNDPGVPEYSYLTWNDICTLLDSGLIEIGNHTYDLHSTAGRRGCARLNGESEEKYSQMLISDLEKLQMLLYENCNTTPVSFAYPFGYLCRESIPVLREIGFKCAFNCYEKPNYITKDPDCLFSLNRYNRPNSVLTEYFMKKVLS